MSQIWIRQDHDGVLSVLQALEMSMRILGASLAFATLIMPALSLPAIAVDTSAQGITLDRESPDQWRASKVAGMTIYGPDNKVVGKIADVLMGHDGRAQDVIVGVGGFLGIGEKDVAIPFAAVSFSDKPMPIATGAPDNNMATTPPASGEAAAVPGATSSNRGTASSTGMGTPADTLGTGNNPTAGTVAAPAAPSTAMPYYGTVAFTAEQLKNAPSFQFAR